MEKIIIYTDGGAKGNPGPGGIGVVVCNEEEQVIKKYSQPLGTVTNNQAEYQAVIFALKKIKLIFGKKKTKELEVLIKTDSQLLERQLNGQYKIMDEKIQPLFIEVWNLKLEFKEVVFENIPREENQEADKLVKQAFEEKSDQKLI
jgi:ribonuclease HI